MTSAQTSEYAFIRDRIERFDAEVSEPLRWLTSYVTSHKALPLYVGFAETIAIQADGTLIRWSHEGEWPGVRPVAEATWVNIALARCVATYPELRRLLPTRPSDAISCDGCGGTGELLHLPSHLREVVCKCGGLGWLHAKQAG
jgi:hypothetical protein